MRIYQTVFSVLFLMQIFLFAGCNKDNESNEIQIGLPERYIKGYTNRIYPVTVQGGSGSYAVEIDDSRIAQVVIETGKSEYNLTIRTKAEGTTYITVKDKQTGESAMFTLVVNKDERGLMIGGIVNRVDAKGENEIKMILNDMDTYRPIPINSTFYVTYDANSFESAECILKYPYQNELISGTIQMKNQEKESIPEVYNQVPLTSGLAASQRWSIDMDGIKWVYDVFIVHVSDENTPNYQLHIYEDLTAYYQGKYPEADVKGVVRVLVSSYN